MGALPLGKSWDVLSAELETLRKEIGSGTMPFCHFQKDRDGQLLFVDEHYCHFLGRAKSEIVGRTDFDLFPAAYAQKYRDDDLHVMAEGKPFRTFESIRKSGGEKCLIYVVKVPDRDELGATTGILGAFGEAPARSDVEARLRESEERQRAIIEQMPVMFAALDDRGHVVFWNSECERVTGFSAGEIVGNPNGLSLLYPDANYLREMMGKWLRREAPMRDWEWTLNCKDGTTRTVAWSNVGGEHPVAGWASWALGIDVTDKKAALERFALVARATTDLVWDQSFISDHLWLSEGIERLLGYAPYQPESTGTWWLSRIHPDDRERIYKGVRVCLHGNDQVWADEYRFQRKDGSYAIVSDRAYILRDANGKALRMIGGLKDLTEQRKLEEDRRRLEAQLQYSQKLESLGVLAGGIAHDFNNLLVSILGHASLALEDMPAQSPARDNLQQIETAAMRAAELCKQMLAYSGKGRFVIRRVNLSELVEEMANLMQVSISKKVTLRFNLEKNLWPIEVDVTQMRQIVMNLITNASEACGENNGSITISTGIMFVDHDYLSTVVLDAPLNEGKYVFLEVSDTGCGMDQETQARIFDPFFTTKATGRGLGMAAVLGIVRGHRGAIKCYSEPGRGTNFKILLPAASGDAEPIEERKSPALPFRTATILVVDDEDGVRILAQRALERQGFKVITACDGREAMEIFRDSQDEISVVLLDMTMPHMSGDEVFREMRKLRDNVRVILSSGYNEQDATNRFVGSGLAAFIQKPYRPSELIELINRVLAGDAIQE